MYAIVDIAGQQFKVEKDQKLYVHRLEGDEGKKVSFDRVLLIDTGNKVAIGDPLLKGASVEAKILGHVKGDKVLVFKKKRRKGYKKLKGHRQFLTQIQIGAISEKTSGAKAPPAKEAKEAPEKKETAAKTTAAKSKTDTGPGAKAKPKAAAKPKAETKPKAAAKPKAEAKPKAAAKPKAETKPKAEAKPKAAAKPKAEDKPEAGEKPGSEEGN